MTILENLKLCNLPNKIMEAKKNIKDFDFTEFEVEEIADAIAVALERREHWLTLDRFLVAVLVDLNAKLKNLEIKNCILFAILIWRFLLLEKLLTALLN